MFNGEYNPKELRMAEQIVREMRTHGIKDKDLFDHNISQKEKLIVRLKDEGAGKQIKPKVSRKKKTIKNPFLKPGEGEVLVGLKCVCGEDIYIEALCAKTAIKNKCVRIAYCVECSNEVKIR